MPKIEGPGFGYGAGAAVLPPEKCATIKTPNGIIHLENISPEQMRLWQSRGDDYALLGRLPDGSPILVYLSDLA